MALGDNTIQVRVIANDFTGKLGKFTEEVKRSVNLRVAAWSIAALRIRAIDTKVDNIVVINLGDIIQDPSEVAFDGRWYGGLGVRRSVSLRYQST